MVQKFAQISNGKVENIAVFKTREDAIRITKAIYGEEAEAVNVEYIDTEAGDHYRDNTFYNVDEDGNEVSPAEIIPTEKQRISVVEAYQNELELALADIIGGSDSDDE